MDVIADGLSAHAKSAGQYSFGFDSTLDGGFHNLPYLAQIVPYSGAFGLSDIFPVAQAGVVAPLQDVLDFRHGVDGIGRLTALAFADDIASPDGIICLGIKCRTVRRNCLEADAVGVEREDRFRFPDNFGGDDGSKYIQNRLVGQVSFAGGGQGAEEGYVDVGGSRRHFVEKHHGGLARSHRMGAGGAVAYLV